MNINKKYIPFAHAKSIYDISVIFFKKLGIKTVLVDLDNTLDSYKALEPNKNALDLKAKLEAFGIKLIILSNNRKKRVAPYANKLGVEYRNSIGKPFTKKLLKFIKEKNLNIDETILVGDQLLTDVLMANKIGLKVILTEKIVEEDQWTTRFNRIREKGKRKKLHKLKLLKDWSEYLYQN